MDLSKYAAKPSPHPAAIETEATDPLDTIQEESSDEPDFTSAEAMPESKPLDTPTLIDPDTEDTLPSPPTSPPPAPSSSPAPQKTTDVVALAERPDLWPRTVRLRRPTRVAFELPGQPPGSIVLPVGSEVSLRKIQGSHLEIARGDFFAVVEVEATNLAELIEKIDLTPPSSPQPTASPSPMPCPSLQKDSPARSLVFREGWQRPPQDSELSAWAELLTVLRPHTTASPSMEIEDTPEIFAGVRLLAPLAEALKIWELDGSSVPARQPTPHPAIPLFFRTFRVPANPSHPLYGESADPNQWATVLTDAKDQVVALELVSETPKTFRPAQSELLTSRFPLNRRKALAHLKIGLEVTAHDATLLIETWVSDERKAECREVVRWYLPRAVANILRAHLDKGLKGKR